MGTLEAYPYKATTDARSALAERFVAYIQDLEFTMPRSLAPFRFRAVYATWSDFNQRAMSGGGLLPAAAVLPDRPTYEPASFGPRELDETWSGGDPRDCDAAGESRYPIGDASGDGPVLVEVAQLAVPLVVVFRAKSKPGRSAILRRLEQIFIEDGTLLDPSAILPGFPIPDSAHPVRYGRVLDVPAYFDRKARYTMLAAQQLDSESSAKENRWLGQLELLAQIQVCTLRRGRAMKPEIRFAVDGDTARAV